MSEHKPVNFFAGKEDVKMLLEFWSMGAKYEQVAKVMVEMLGVYIPRDQYELCCKAFDISLELDIGSRQAELGREVV